MRPITRITTHAAGESIDIPLAFLDELEVKLHTSDVVMIAGPPGAGKSTVGMRMALASPESSLYICADTSELVIRRRLTAMVTKMNQSEVDGRLHDREWLKDKLQPAAHIQWAFPSNPSIDEIQEELESYLEVMGEYPKLIFIDNLMDVQGPSGGDNEWVGMKATMRELKHLARTINAVIVVLHHTSENATVITAPPMSSIQGKLSQLPAVSLTVRNDVDMQQMFIGAVKNRYGKSDPAGNHYALVPFNGAAMQLG